MDLTLTELIWAMIGTSLLLSVAAVVQLIHEGASLPDTLGFRASAADEAGTSLTSSNFDDIEPAA